MFILHIETSTNICSVAVSNQSDCVFSVSNNEGMNHAALLSVFIQEAMQHLKTLDLKLDAVAVSSGPGSYTGLRIGVSTAKGLCYGLEIPLISVSTLEVLTVSAINMIADNEPHVLFCPMIDARRMEVYSGFYDRNLQTYREITADIIDESSYAEVLEQNTIYFFGNGAEKCKQSLTHKNAKFVDHIVPAAENMIPLAVKRYNAKKFEDVAYFEPFYLKEFHTTSPKK